MDGCGLSLFSHRDVVVVVVTATTMSGWLCLSLFSHRDVVVVVVTATTMSG